MKDRKLKVLVTGHKGFVGSVLYKELQEMADVGTLVGIDLKDGRNILNCELPAADIVFHLAAEPGVIKSMEDPYSNALTNIMGTIRLCEKYKKSRFVFTSSGGTIQETIISPYGLSKKTCEEYIKMLCDDYAIVRLPNVFGPNSRSVIDKFIKDDFLTIYGDGKQNRTYAYIHDVVRALINASVNYGVGLFKLGGFDHTVLDLAKATGKGWRYLAARPGELKYSHLEPNVDFYTSIGPLDWIWKHCKEENI